MAKSKLYMGLIAVTGWFALILQFALAISKFVANGMTLLGSLIQILSYFTILTNLLLALSLSIVLISPHSRLGIFFSKPSSATSLSIYISVVGLVYNIVLRPLWKPEGLDRVSDELLHSVIPVLYILYWLIIIPKGLFSIRILISGLGYPFLYSIYVLLRGSINNLYPYPFMDVSEHGYGTVLFNMLLVLILFLLIGLLFLFIDRRMGRRLQAR